MTTPHAAQTEMGLFDHLRELRKRLLLSLLFVTIGACLAYSYSLEVFTILSVPFVDAFGGSPLIETSPAAAWLIKVKVSLLVGTLLVCPLLFHQAWLFIAPGLYEEEQKLVVPFVLVSTILFLGGVWFCYSVVLPFTFGFFYEQFRSINVTPTIKMSEHLSVTLTALVAFGAVFELPLATYFVARAGLIDHKTLIGFSRYAIVIIFVVAAVFTPPDVITQFLMAGPLLILYAISIGVAKVASRPPLDEAPEEPDSAE